MSAFMTPELLAQAEQLLETLRQGDEPAARQALMNLTEARESLLFKEIGSITRDLHDSLRQFSEDSRLDALTAQDMPDARERLRYVTSLTEQAANRTLGAAEQALPLTDNLIRRSQRVTERLTALRELHPGNQALQDALGPVETYLASVNREGEQVRAQLNEIILAQEYQDLTGQLLHRVILLLERLEGEMVKLIRLVGSTGQACAGDPEEATRAEGPALPTAKAGVVQSQDEVDDLLASLGF
ncbi:MAG: protein phosphatase CheZ [Pseudomonadota bacterium]|jgi:chemotaxis protein CheZ